VPHTKNFRRKHYHIPQIMVDAITRHGDSVRDTQGQSAGFRDIVHKWLTQTYSGKKIAKEVGYEG
jgi:hypothetical protein